MQSLPNHAQATIATPLTIRPEFSVCENEGLGGAGGRPDVTANGNPILQYQINFIYADMVNLNLLGEFPADEIINVDIDGSITIVSVDGPSETDQVFPFIGGPYNRNFTPGINTIPPNSNDNIILEAEHALFLVAPASQGESITYRFDFLFQTTINNPTFEGIIEDVTESFFVTFVHEGLSPSGIILFSGSMPGCST